ncbi:MAG: glucose-1-phosphate thymidylyltransferase [Ferruginibacter sp.]|nr:glucose-1-phosphate thymidylyltransferase [Chitinophagaceae bacterium]MBP6285457.1 glucose-1-phosphate thymidylyltransferase [Ferruginibacter sp.]MBU9937031.1 glucose-1-phosphate thymidylyltransferase [Ferruginibacter sp.]
MQKIIFTEEYCKPENLHPFTYTRHIQDIRIGILTIREKWERYLKILSANKWEDHYLDNEQSIKIEKGIGRDDYLLVHANVLPTAAVISKIKKLKNGEFLFSGTEGGVAYKFSNKEVLGLHKIKVSYSVEYRGDLKAIHYPWQIFQLNDWALREDFSLITGKRRSKAISGTNKTVKPSQIFLEPGVKMEHCFLNAEDGPIYIGKNATIMEGASIRGPVAICEGAVIKMGTKIYGATTIGPFCTVGGEIKNSVLFAYSNKAHDGYLGDSVLGEWCNLGAGTTNSNVKNNAGEVKYWLDADKKEMAAGNKGGLLMGDYSKAAINTSFNTGTVVGVCCNVVSPGLTPKLIPNFSWGVDGITKYKLNKALVDIDNWKKMKGTSITGREKQVLTDIYKLY